MKKSVIGLVLGLMFLVCFGCRAPMPTSTISTSASTARFQVEDPDAYGAGREELIRMTQERLRREAQRLAVLARERAVNRWVREDDVPVRLLGNRVLIHPSEVRALYTLQDETASLLRGTRRAWCVAGAEQLEFFAFPEAGDVLDPVYGVQCWLKTFEEGEEPIPLRPVIAAAGQDEAMYRRYRTPQR